MHRFNKLMPLYGLLVWLIALAVYAALFPVFAWAGPLGLGILMVAGAAVLIIGSVGVIGCALVAWWRTNIVFRFVPAVASLIVMTAGIPLIPVVAELSWQTIYGPRDVKIWKYART